MHRDLHRRDKLLSVLACATEAPPHSHRNTGSNRSIADRSFPRYLPLGRQGKWEATAIVCNRLRAIKQFEWLSGRFIREVSKCPHRRSQLVPMQQTWS
jgi:hypothetical protein